MQAGTLKGTITGEAAEIEQLTSKALQLLALCEQSFGTNGSQEAAREALAIAYEINDKRIIGDSLYWMARNYSQEGELISAVNSFLEAEKNYSALGLLPQVAKCHFHLGECCFKIRDFESSLQSYLTALRIHKDYEELPMIAEIYSRIGTLYQNTRDWQRALDSFGKALELYEQLDDPRSVTIALFSIGNVYNWKDDLDNSSAYLLRSEAKAKETGDEFALLKAVSSLSILYTKLKEFDKSLQYFEHGLSLAEKLGEEVVRASMLKSLGNLYNQLGQHDKAIEVLNEALHLTERLDLTGVLVLIHQFYSDAYEALGDYKKALYHFKEYNRYDQQMTRAEIKLKEKGLQAKHDLDEARRQSELYRLKNIDLAQAYDEIIRQKAEIQQKNKEITDSITYARRIQEVILPREELISQKLSDYFIFYKPKDIVSGDFYFFNTIAEKTRDTGQKKIWIIVAAVDCTGHGVPGAFMSMIGNNVLNQVVIEKEVTSPADALKVINEKVVQSLKQYDAGNSLSDGMDMALCAIDLDNLFMQYAGAHRPLLIIRKGEAHQYKASKYAIGGYHREDKVFNDVNIRLQKGDAVYLFTDGFADQFGGPKGKKFKYKNLVKMLTSVHSLSMQEQKRELEKTFSDWRGDLEQVDDVLVIGIRI